MAMVQFKKNCFFISAKTLQEISDLIEESFIKSRGITCISEAESLQLCESRDLLDKAHAKILGILYE